VILLDAYALTALLADEPAADDVEQLLSSESTAVATANLAEAADRLARIHQIAVSRTRTALDSLEQSTNLRIRAVEPAHAWRAAGLRANHYHRSRRPLSLGDCLLLAMTGEDDRLATADPYVLATAEDEEIGWIALPDSRGRRYERGK
jgi:PIN domain nuclease of toxin-antitoxin system